VEPETTFEPQKSGFQATAPGRKLSLEAESDTLKASKLTLARGGCSHAAVLLQRYCSGAAAAP